MISINCILQSFHVCTSYCFNLASLFLIPFQIRGIVVNVLSLVFCCGSDLLRQLSRPIGGSDKSCDLVSWGCFDVKCKIGGTRPKPMAVPKNMEGQYAGSGVYHPCLNMSHYVSPRGVGITNTITSAELAAIAAAIIHGYSHIATDSLTSMHQIKKQLSHPNLHRQQIQGDVLQSIAKAIHQSP